MSSNACPFEYWIFIIILHKDLGSSDLSVKHMEWHVLTSLYRCLFETLQMSINHPRVHVSWQFVKCLDLQRSLWIRAQLTFVLTSSGWLSVLIQLSFLHRCQSEVKPKNVWNHSTLAWMPIVRLAGVSGFFGPCERCLIWCKMWETKRVQRFNLQWVLHDVVQQESSGGVWCKDIYVHLSHRWTSGEPGRWCAGRNRT